MKASAVITGSAVVVAIAATIFAAIEHREAKHSRFLLDAAAGAWRNDLDRLRARIEKLEVAPPAADHPADEVERARDERLAADRRHQQELAKQRAQEARAAAELAQRVPFLPEIQQINSRHFTAGLPLRYGALYRMLGLSSEQIASFESLQAERFWAFADLAAASQAQRLSRTDPAYTEMRERTMAPIEAQLQAMLGAGSFQAYLAFEQSAPTRTLVESAAGRITATAAALTAEQIDQLTSVLSAHHSAGVDALSGDAWLEAQVLGQDRTKGSVNWADIEWEAAAPGLRRALAPAQFVALEALWQQAQLGREAAVLRDDTLRELRLRQQEAAQATRAQTPGR